ncbi:hypothetical protein F4604DRAFT_1673854 [Suillus subluteus]|nr:hypothetical protein F4604DRAFT_1673854 [Suillus subluteus]
MEGDNDRRPIDPPTNQDIVEAVVLLQKLKQFYLPPLIRLEQRLDSDSVGQRLQHMEQTLEPQPSERRQQFGRPEQSPIENTHWAMPQLLSAHYVTRQLPRAISMFNVPRSCLKNTCRAISNFTRHLVLHPCPYQSSHTTFRRICGYSDPCGVIQNVDEGLFFRAISSFFALTGEGILTFENEGVNFLVRYDGMYNEIISSPAIQEKTLDVFDDSWSKKSWASSNPFLRRQKAFDAVAIDLRVPMSGYTDKEVDKMHLAIVRGRNSKDIQLY